jgi:hypothetical protein
MIRDTFVFFLFFFNQFYSLPEYEILVIYSDYGDDGGHCNV